MNSNECLYCDKDDTYLRTMMSFIMDLPSAKVYLWTKNSDYPGRCIVALDNHKTEIFYLETKERHDFFDSVSIVAKAMKNSTKAGKINYGIFGDEVSHLHVHVVPKIKDGKDWNKYFTVTRDDYNEPMTPEQIEKWTKKLKLEIESLIKNEK